MKRDTACVVVVAIVVGLLVSSCGELSSLTAPSVSTDRGQRQTDSSVVSILDQRVD